MSAQQATAIPTIVPLRRVYANRHGVPLIERVDAAIFTATYGCDFADRSCGDGCCAHGVCVDAVQRRIILAHAEGLEAFLGIPRERWFAADPVADAEAPGGSHYRTRVVAGSCVFRAADGYGCRLHAYCYSNGLDYHLLKPMLSTLFPVTVDAGLLRPSFEVLERSLHCRDRGRPLYAGTRVDLGYYYGEALLSELDVLMTCFTQ